MNERKEKYTYYIKINGFYLKSIDFKKLEYLLTQNKNERKLFHNLENAKIYNQHLHGDICEQYEIKSE